MFPIHSQKHDQTPSGQTLIENWVLLFLHPYQKPPIVKRYSSAPWSQLLRVLFDSFLFWGMGTEAFHVCLLSCVSVGINAMAKVTSLSFTVSRSMDLVLTHGFHVSSGSTDHKHQHSPPLLHRPRVPFAALCDYTGPWTSPWHQTAGQASQVNMAPGSSMAHRYPHDFEVQHDRWTPTCLRIPASWTAWF